MEGVSERESEKKKRTSEWKFIDPSGRLYEMFTFYKLAQH